MSADVFAPFTLPLRREGDAAIVDKNGKTVLVIDPDRDLEDDAATRIADLVFGCLSAAPRREGVTVKLHLKLLDTLKPFAEVAEKLKRCHVVEICEPTPDNPSCNIIPMPCEWFERAADDLETIAIQLHGAGALSEGQASKLTGLDRVEVRKLADAIAALQQGAK